MGGRARWTRLCRSPLCYRAAHRSLCSRSSYPSRKTPPRRPGPGSGAYSGAGPALLCSRWSRRNTGPAPGALCSPGRASLLSLAAGRTGKGRYRQRRAGAGVPPAVFYKEQGGRRSCDRYRRYNPAAAALRKLTILEPSAGSGAIVDELTAWLDREDYHSRSGKQNVYCCEADPELRAVLHDKGYK
nr:hypothetical protein [Tanacetum cinerariifolium]